MTWTEAETMAQRLSGWRLDSADVKARRYVGQFCNRHRIGLKIIADLQGRQGACTVSLDVRTQAPTGATTCHIGARGGCHRVRALAETFLDD